MNKNTEPNRLIHETSPYLLQHAYNPVDWWPWCEEAFAKAKAEDKPVFLSIGYSTCHWCHVMERESFEDTEAARLLNDGFIAVKVDKEERQDIDSVYMGVCQALTGRGGWPLTILMTAEQKPFFAGTYLPKRGRFGQTGLMELLELVRAQWNTDRARLLRYGEQITSAAERAGTAAAASRFDGRQVIALAYAQLRGSFDARYGGFGAAPKFPTPHQLLLLLRGHHLHVGDRALEMAEQTLTAMYRGGIYDHIGGGFSRYSTDRQWLAPHFEKMLYDNALLVMALLECYQVTGTERYRYAAEQTLGYVRREMTGPEGGFYAAQDADSDGEEGKYYTFTRAEILQVLGAQEGEHLCRRYGVTAQGNFEGKNILNLIHDATAPIPDKGLARQLERLRAYRAGRCPLHTDDKRLTSWNALMIVACAKARRVLGEQVYLDMAEGAYRFLMGHVLSPDGALCVSWRDGRAKGAGLLDDYACLAWASLALYETTFSPDYLRQACRLMERVISRFMRAEGGCCLTPEGGEELLYRPVEQYDGAIPSGNSVAAWCLTRLAALTGEERWRAAAQRQLESFGGLFQARPTACTFALLALMQEVFPSQQLLCALPDVGEKERFAFAWGRTYHPQTAALVKSPADETTLSALAPFTERYPMKDHPLFYLCQDQACAAPVATLGEVLDQLPGSVAIKP
ncbi:MAG: thioredoxin domain-containing protein [Oscillospiraceae bacterium]|nr:thioredoxin domain-containing protein [Oscillospiraceae bacterium]